MCGEYTIFYESPKNWGYYAHAQTVCTRPLLRGEGPGNEATSEPDPTCKMSACAHTAMQSQLLFCPLLFCPLYCVCKLEQTHTTALHNRCTNCAPNTIVFTSQGSWIEIENTIQVFSVLGCLKYQSVYP